MFIMSSLVSRLIFPSSLFLLTLASGFWVSHSGKPYSTLVFTIHKLISLAAIVATAVTFNYLHKTNEIRLAIEAGAIIITGLLFLCLLATGAMLSIGKPALAAIRTIHHIAPYLAIMSAAATVSLLVS
jgi:uncharacterized integral membrane protein